MDKINADSKVACQILLVCDACVVFAYAVGCRCQIGLPCGETREKPCTLNGFDALSPHCGSI